MTTRSHKDINNPEDLATLPQWAQQGFRTLLANLEYAKGKLAVGPKDSDTFIDYYEDPPRGLGKGTSVRFGELGHDKSFDVAIDEKSVLSVRANNWTGAMVIEPLGHNTINVHHPIEHS